MRRVGFLSGLLCLCLSVSVFAQTGNEDIMPQYKVVSCRYWFDMNQCGQQVGYSSTLNIDASALDEGLHSFHYQVIADNGSVSPVVTTFFNKLSQDSDFKEYSIQSVRYWFDMDSKASVTSYSNTLNLDLSALDEGLHSFHYQVIADNGAVSPVVTTFFNQVMGSPEFETYRITEARFGFDSIAGLRPLEFDAKEMLVDASETEEGDHELYFQLVADNGSYSPIYSKAFYRSLYDILIRDSRLYNDSTIQSEPVLTQKPDLKIDYVMSDVNRRGQLTLDNTEVISLGKFCEAAYWGSVGDNSKYTAADASHYHPTSLVSNGKIRSDSVLVKLDVYKDRWHFLSLPFNVRVADIAVKEGNYWVIRKYDGKSRAESRMDETWRNLGQDDIMEAGQGYILQVTNDRPDKTVVFTFHAVNDIRKNDIFKSADVAVPLAEYQAEFAHNRSWNLVGNPYPSFYNTKYIGTGGTITVWKGNSYAAYSLLDDEYILMPFESFFVQRPLDAYALVFDAAGRQHSYTPQPRLMASTKNAMHGQNARSIFNFELSDGMESDRCRIVLNDKASMEYETDRDASKFMEDVPRIAQLYSTFGGVNYAINERPLSDGTALLSVLAPVNGEYTLSLNTVAGAENIVVLDTRTGDKWYPVEGDYSFNAVAGTDEARFIISFDGKITGIGQSITDADGISVVDGKLVIGLDTVADIRIFGADGKLLYSMAAASAQIPLDTGIYLLEIDGTSRKIVVK
mgnify:CR=1 FL=1